jgi:predicted GIY-YIG superfamily endonuclease
MREVKRRQGQQIRRFQDDDDNFHVECKRCKQIKPETLEFFYKQKTTKSGLRSICKSCCDDYHMNRYENEEGFRERAVELQREWSRNNPDKVRANKSRQREKALKEDPDGYRKKIRKSIKSWKAGQPAGIYKITCIKNGRVYIGESKCMRMRWSSHKSDLRRDNAKTNTLLQEDWDKFGEQAFVFEVLEELPKDKDVLLEREYHYINNAIKEGAELYNNAGSLQERKRNKKIKDNGIGCLYQITCNQNTRVYIGQTSFWRRRKNHHKSNLIKGSHANKQLQEDWNQYGEKCFEFTILEKNDSKDFLLTIEKQKINELVSKGVKLYNTYGLSLEQINSLDDMEE